MSDAKTLGPYTLGPGGDLSGVYTGDARELAGSIPDASVDLIFADPVYDALDDYAWLATFALRVLKETGQLLVYQAHAYLPQTFAALSRLRYIWTLAEDMSGANARLYGYGLFVNWRPLLWYAKSRHRPFQPFGPDLARAGVVLSGNHRWNKNLEYAFRWCRALSSEGEIVIDPFCGGGSILASAKSLGRLFLGFEIKPEVAVVARQLIRQTPVTPLLFDLDQQEAEQLELMEG